MDDFSYRLGKAAGIGLNVKSAQRSVDWPATVARIGLTTSILSALGLLDVVSDPTNPATGEPRKKWPYVLGTLGGLGAMGYGVSNIR